MDDRTVLNGIVWKFRTGTAWRDVPERYGSWATLHTRFRRWANDGTFERMHRAAQAKADAAGDIEWLVWASCSPHPRGQLMGWLGSRTTTSVAPAPAEVAPWAGTDSRPTSSRSRTRGVASA